MKLICIIFCICVISISCIRQAQESKQQITISENDTISHSDYYKNGVLQETGQYYNNHKVGEWVEWYSDGTIKWNGFYNEENERVVDIYQQTPIVQFNSDVTELETNIEYHVKIIVEGLHPKDMVISTNNKIEMTFNHKNDIFSFNFKEKGTVILNVYAGYLLDDFFVGEIVLEIK